MPKNPRRTAPENPYRITEERKKEIGIRKERFRKDYLAEHGGGVNRYKIPDHEILKKQGYKIMERVPELTTDRWADSSNETRRQERFRENLENIAESAAKTAFPGEEKEYGPKLQAHLERAVRSLPVFDERSYVGSHTLGSGNRLIKMVGLSRYEKGEPNHYIRAVISLHPEANDDAHRLANFIKGIQKEKDKVHVFPFRPQMRGVKREGKMPTENKNELMKRGKLLPETERKLAEALGKNVEHRETIREMEFDRENAARVHQETRTAVSELENESKELKNTKQMPTKRN